MLDGISCGVRVVKCEMRSVEEDFKKSDFEFRIRYRTIVLLRYWVRTRSFFKFLCGNSVF
jgi:hypothetical protein